MVHHINVPSSAGGESNIVGPNGVPCDTLLEAVLEAGRTVSGVLVPLCRIVPVIHFRAIVILFRVGRNSGVLGDPDQIFAFAVRRPWLIIRGVRE